MGNETKKRPTANEALQILKDGNQRFVDGVPEHPNHNEEVRQLLSKGQAPIATILTCADSRVPPVNIFDQGLGDLFVVRVAGNVIGDHSLGSIEYAVAHLNTKLVVVMGHAECGAVAAVASGTALEGHINSVAPAIQTALKKVEESSTDVVNDASKELAKHIAEKIAESEPIISDMVNTGDVKVIAAYYELATGEVTFYDN